MLFIQTARAQAGGNECSGAFVISPVENYCSLIGAGDNLSATPGNVATPACWPAAAHDVWFSFTAAADKMVVVIAGNTLFAPSGTLQNPAVALYGGDCTALTELGCAASTNGMHIIELRVDNLTPGNTYYFRVDGSNQGTFQYCLRNYFFDGTISGDCPTGVVLCDKSPFNVGDVVGPGVDNTELNDADCFQSINGEINSTWFVWTAANDGTLDFTLTPNSANDDLDFVLYRLPNGPGNCTGKTIERCMAAGANDPASPCMGPTGLNSTATDVSQVPGCTPGADNFLRTLDMTAGTTYALAINNFTTSGNGFQVEWGGTGQFVGPIGGFKTDEPDAKICLGETIVFTDTSKFAGSILTEWHWNFGANATPATAITQGPHTVQYTVPGDKIITLSVKSAAGCSVTGTKKITVEPCCALQTNVKTSPACPDVASAAAQLQNSVQPVLYLWSNGQTDSITTNLTPGNYTLTVQDATGCRDSVSFVIQPISVTLQISDDTLLVKGQGTAVLVATGSVPTGTFNWSDGVQSVGSSKKITVMPTETTTYTVTYTVDDCILIDTVRVQVATTDFDMPNVFTPNGDQVNDVFGAFLPGGTVLELSIWERWGEPVFLDIATTWDGLINGLPAPSDVYVYRIRVRKANGEEVVRNGDVTLLR